jgi:dTDP-4-dehydrorhamnose reductase
MSRILILGGSGMLGHQLWRHFSAKYPETYTTIRKTRADYTHSDLFCSTNVIESVDARCFDFLKGVIAEVRPDIILNGIGITKRRERIKTPVDSIRLNALLPHELANWGGIHGVKIINFSTDCVFDGKHGNYTEDCPTSAKDLYGKTKALGEVCGENVLTIRSSFIGQELQGGTELFEWFLAQTVSVKGFTHAIYSGLTTIELSRVVEKMILTYPQSSGLYNISSEPISKYNLLELFKKALQLDIDIIPDDTFRCDRSLNSDRFQLEFNYFPPSWENMVEELICDLKRRRDDFRR